MSSTLYFLELQVRNFMSFGNNLTAIDLSAPGTISIEGQNLDIGGSNGAGKCLYPETRINIRVNEVEQTITIGELYELARSLEAHTRRNN